MVLGPRTKNRKSPTVHLDYLIHIQEVRPWPPSQSLRNLRSVLIQWELGERNSGSTEPVVPLLGAGVGDGKIEFNVSFRLPVTLLRDMSIKGGDSDTFRKNCLEFNLYEPRRDKTVRGQLLGTAIIDLADYGIVKGNLSVSIPINSKRSYGKTAQPVLFLKLQSIEKGRTGTSSRDNLSKQAFAERNGGESVSALMDEEYAEEAEFASITDDDVSSHSSLALSSSAFETNGGLSPHSEEAVKDSAGEAYNHHLTSKPGLGKIETETMNELSESLKVTSSADLSPDIQSLAHGHAALSNFPETSLTSMPKQIVAHSVQSSSLSINYEGSEEEINSNMRSKDYDNMVQDTNCGNEICSDALQGSKGYKLNDSLARVASLDHQVDEKSSFAISTASQVNQEDIDKVRTPAIETIHYVARANCGPAKETDRKEDEENGQGAQILLERQHSMEDQPWNRFSQDDTRKQVSSGSDALSSNGENLGLRSNILNNDKLRHVKSVRSPLESTKTNGSVRSVKLGDAQNGTQGLVGNEKKDTKAYAKETRNLISDGRIQKLEHRIKMLEGELREAAAIEVGLYSVVAEHGSSISKVHAPARRLSRLYLHVCKDSSLSRRASAARSVVSGLVLVAKACGNDVPRLTFWLSNSVVLRAIISRAFAEQQLPLPARPGSGKANRNKLSSLKWKESSSSKETKSSLCGSVDWEDPCVFISALEKIEAWIFSRIIESVWWQTLTPHMQAAAAKAINRGMAFSASKTYRRTCSSVDQDQVNFSLDLWKKAFKDARERLCPVRAGGHECGCLPVLARLIMEQCVARLDVAMFNAILRESDDEIPTDPVSDPISDAKVLPIPAGKASFGAGAQLKNAIGNWSRWLTDLFDIDDDDDDDDDDSLEDKNDHNNNDDKKGNEHGVSKSFHLLNALSDLMMLPKDMLLSSSSRKEVCPTIGAPLIKRVLSNFVPDEFCPDPIPDGLLEALDSEDALEAWEDCVTNFPCSAAPIVYLPPPAVSFASIIGESGSQSQLRRSGSSVLNKSYTSDDELDELDSPLTTIIGGFQTSPSAKRPSWMSKEYGSGNTVRYQLLREVWMNSE